MRLNSFQRTFVKMDRKTWNVVQLGISFMLIFSAFNTQSFIEEPVIQSVSKERSLAGKSAVDPKAGYFSLSIIYAVFTFSNFLVPPIIGKLGSKWSMVLGASMYCLFMLGFLRLTPAILYASSALLGFGAAILWTGQGNYLTLNSTNETIGRNSGMLWAMMQSCLIVGGTFLYAMFRSSQVIKEANVRLLYTCFSGVCVAGTICLALLGSPEKQNRQQSAQNQEDDVDALVESVSVTNQQVVDSVTTVTMPQDSLSQESQREKPGCFKDFLKTFRLLKTRNMALLAVVFMYSGIELTFWSGIYSTCLAFTLKFGHNANTMMAFNAFALGVGQIIGGGTFGIFGHRTNKYGRNPIILLGTVVHLAAFFLIFLNIPMEAPMVKTESSAWIHPSMPLAIFCGFLLGFADSCWNTQIYSLLGSLYPNDSAPAFALFKFFQSLTASGSFYYGSALLLHWQLLSLCLGAVLAALCFFPVEWDAQTRPNGMKLS